MDTNTLNKRKRDQIIQTFLLKIYQYVNRKFKKGEILIPQDACDFIQTRYVQVSKEHKICSFDWHMDAHVIDNIHVDMSVCTILHHETHVK